jgi:hypothetical protein
MFKEGDRVRVMTDGTPTVKHPKASKSGDLATVSHYYMGGVTKTVWVEFDNGHREEFNEVHLATVE